MGFKESSESIACFASCLLHLGDPAGPRLPRPPSETRRSACFAALQARKFKTAGSPTQVTKGTRHGLHVEMERVVDHVARP